MLQEFIHMDGFALWVWSAFGLTGLVMAVAAAMALYRHRRILQQLRHYHAEGSRR